MSFRYSPQPLYGISACFAIGAVLLSIWLQIYKEIPPCPLCLINRFFLGVVGLIYLIRAFFFKLNPYFKFIFYISSVTTNLLGILVSARQLYLEYQPHPLIACQAHITQYTDRTILKTLIRSMLAESGTCYNPPKFCYLSFATWTLFIFSLLMLTTVIALTRENKT